MKRIAIDGVIGWDVMAADIRAELKEAKGDDIDLIISSPGGSVYEGLAIFNAIRDYRRDAIALGGKTSVTARVVGLGASMASYIPMAANKVVVEDNAIWMIHNPWSFAIGDQNDMRKEADILDGIASVLASAYVNKTGKEKSEIRDMMDVETFLFGDEIVTAGFADEVEPAGEGAEDEDDAVAMARTSIEAMKHAMQKEPEKQQMDKAAAMIREIRAEIVDPAEPDVIGKDTAATAESPIKEGDVDIKSLKTEHPEVFAEAVNIGVMQERARVTELRTYTEADPDNLKVAEVINEAIAGGQSVADINAKLQVAIRDGGQLAGENPPGVETVATVDPLGAEDKAAAKLAGMTDEEYRKYSKEEA